MTQSPVVEVTGLTFNPHPAPTLMHDRRRTTHGAHQPPPILFSITSTAARPLGQPLSPPSDGRQQLVGTNLGRSATYQWTTGLIDCNPVQSSAAVSNNYLNPWPARQPRATNRPRGGGRRANATNWAAVLIPRADTKM